MTELEVDQPGWVGQSLATPGQLQRIKSPTIAQSVKGSNKTLSRRNHKPLMRIRCSIKRPQACSYPDAQGIMYINTG